MPSRLLLLRHGQSTWNVENRWQGWADAPLSQLGEAQARDAAVHLTDAGLTRAASSDLGRARRTAELLAAGLGLPLPVAVDRDLRERHVPEFEGLVGKEIAARYPKWAETRELPPGAETDGDLVARAVPALVRLAAANPDDFLLVVSHGGLMRAVERAVGLDPGRTTSNLAGRWYAVDIEGGALEPGESVTLVDPELATAPPPR